MSLASPSDQPPSRWSSALQRLRQRYPNANRGDQPDGRPPYAVIRISLFKSDADQSDQSDHGTDFDQDAYARIEEGIERVIRVNRNTHLSSLIDLGFPITCGAFMALGWASGLTAALAFVDALSRYQ